MRKLFSLSLTIVFLLSIIVSPVIAVERPVVDRTTNAGSKAAEKKQAAQDRREAKATDRTGTLQERAEKEISRRIESLQKLLTRLTELKKISATQKASLTTQVQTEINTLTALQAKIVAETDPAIIKTDVQSIVTSYRIYALFMPKIHILGAGDRILTIADEMTVHTTQLETKIAEQEANGQDVTDAQALLVSLNQNITTAKTQAQSAIDTVTPLAPEGYPGNKTQLESAFTLIRSAHQSLKSANQDARKIITWLVRQKNVTTPAVTATP